MALFKKKMSDEELIQKNIAAQQAELESANSSNKNGEDSLGDSKLAVEVTKLKAQIEGLNEQRKAVNERFSRISEEIGELRGLIVETNKGVSRIEAASTKAIDLVESVKPEELMIEVRKQDSKIEALKANLESNETMLSDSMKELKEIRRKMDFYKGAEQIAKMNEEIKKELIDIKKSEAVIERHSNKVESIFIDVEKKYSELDKFDEVTKDLQRTFSKIQSDLDKLKVKTEDLVEKKELVKLISKFNEFEKHTSNVINLLDEKSKTTNESINREFTKISRRADDKINEALRKINVVVDDKQDEIPGQISMGASSDARDATNQRKKGFSLKKIFGQQKREENQDKSKNEPNQ